MEDSDDALSVDTSDEPPPPMDPDEDPEGIDVHPLPEVGGGEGGAWGAWKYFPAWSVGVRIWLRCLKAAGSSC